jgi:hypothetical protein
VEKNSPQARRLSSTLARRIRNAKTKGLGWKYCSRIGKGKKVETRTMPESITAMRAVTYSTDQIIEDLAEAHEKPVSEVTLEEVMDWVSDNAVEDLAWARNGIIYQDQDGGEIEL